VFSHGNTLLIFLRLFPAMRRKCKKVRKIAGFEDWLETERLARESERNFLFFDNCSVLTKIMTYFSACRNFIQPVWGVYGRGGQEEVC